MANTITRTVDRIGTEDGLSIITESIYPATGDILVREAHVPAGGGSRSRGTKKDTGEGELWQLGASISSINDTALRERLYIKKYIMEEDDINLINASIYSINDTAYRDKVNMKKYISEGNNIKVTISEDIILRKPKIINENVTVTLLSTRIKE